jgi:hypothetical protein
MYVDYTDTNGDTTVAEYTMNGMIAVTSVAPAAAVPISAL